MLKTVRQKRVVEVTTQEFGGCLPREHAIKDTINRMPENILYLNTGRSAIYTALFLSSIKKILLPYYTCPTIKDFLLQQGISVREYNINEDFIPNVKSVEADELILCTDYYGCTNRWILEECVNRYGERMIMDNCQSFCGEPSNCKYNVYSPRKFIGVSCGGLLLYNSKIDEKKIEDWQEDNSSESFLDIADKEGSNAAYQSYCENEEEYRKKCKKAPQSVVKVLKHTDYEYIKNRRTAMFNRLLEEFGESEKLSVDYKSRGCNAYVFPMWVEDIDCKKHLVEKKVYCSTWWRRVLISKETTQFEKDLVQHLVPIPIDHRYKDEDIEDLVRIIKSTIS